MKSRGTQLLFGGLIACSVVAMTLPAGLATAGPASLIAGAAVSQTAAKAAPRVELAGGPKLVIRVQPGLAGIKSWRFTLQRKSGQTWKTVGGYETRGRLEEIALGVKSGSYRVVVPAQHGYKAMTSPATKYRPTPEFTIGGAGAIEVQVAPRRGWQVTLERKTENGWKKVRTAKPRGENPLVFPSQSGTHRLSTEAAGRFPKFTSTSFVFRPRSPKGPIDQRHLGDVFAGDQGPDPGDESCGSVMNQNSGTGLIVASGFVSLIPVAGPVFAAGLNDAAAYAGDAATSAGSACLEAEFQLVNSQLGFQESQIQSLQDDLKKTQNVLIQEAYVAQSEIAGSAAANYDVSTGEIQDQFTGFMQDAQFWSGPAAPIADASVSTSATSPTVFAALVSFTNGVEASGNFPVNVDEISGSEVNCSGSSLLPPVSADDPIPNCYKSVSVDPGSYLYLLYSALALQLQTEIENYRNEGANVVPLFDSYNQGLSSFYQESLGVLQQAFQMEYLVNQINFYNGANTSGSPSTALSSLGDAPGTWYSYPALQETLGSAPTAAQQTAVYNAAQKALTQLYAARVNQLYRNAIGFTISDVPVAPQAYPTGGPDNINAVFDDTNIGLYVEGAGLPAKTPLGLLPSVATNGETWMSNAVLYQYVGLRNIGTCLETLQAYDAENGATGSLLGPNGALNDTTCPSILTTASGGAVSAPPTSDDTSLSCGAYASPDDTVGGSCYDGNTLSPYSNETGTITMGSSIINNLMLCDETAPTLTWWQVDAANAGNAAGLTAGDFALTCGNWGETGSNHFPGSTPPSSITGLDAQGNEVTVSWADTTQPLAANFGMQVSFSTLWGRDDIGSYQNMSPQLFNDTPYSPVGYYYPLASQVSSEAWSYTTVGSPPPGNFSGWWTYYNPASTTPPLNLGGPQMTTTVEFGKTGLGACSVFLPIPGSPGTEGVALNQSTCTLSFPSIEVESDWTNDEAVGEVAMATIGVIVPNALGADYGGFYLPVTIGMAAGVTGGLQYITSSAPGVDYCKGKGTAATNDTACTIAAVWISSGTDIQQVGYTAPPASVSCSDPYQAAGGTRGDWSTTCSGIFSSEGAVTVADGSTFTFNLGRIADGQGEFSVIP
ncbi:MAG: hypothetical protein ACKOYQ_01165 [Actinomycetota bacterium]